MDTRGKEKSGGQYGVSIADSAGTIGKYRYLLFDLSATEMDDPFGNTFLSHVSVIDANESNQPQPAVPAGPAERLTSQSPASAKHQITIDYSETPELADWVKTKLQPTCDTWYPKIVEWLPSKEFTAPDRVSITITNKYRGVAATGGDRISCGAVWFKQNVKGEALGAVVHELVHVVQRYRGVRGGSPNPGWLVEGVADYIRWFKYEPQPTGTRPRNLDKANYTDSYRTTAGFLNYVVEKHDKTAHREAQRGHAGGSVQRRPVEGVHRQDGRRTVEGIRGVPATIADGGGCSARRAPLRRRRRVLAEVDASRVVSMCLVDRPPQPVGGSRRGDHVDVIGHQTISPDFHRFCLAPLGHQRQVGRVILVAEERRLPTVSALGDVVRHPGNNNTPHNRAMR